MKPLGGKSYGSIPHLIGSRVGPSDHHVQEGQHRIATAAPRDKHDVIIVQEKLDGGNVGVCKVNGQILSITRAGYLAETSKYQTHHSFKKYVDRNVNRFDEMLNEGERICGEWLLTAVGTIYRLYHDPFVPFDLINQKGQRECYGAFIHIANSYDFVTPRLVSIGAPLSVESALKATESSAHGAIGPAEGAVWRVERNDKVDFLCKYVRHDKVDGIYLQETIFNEMPSEFNYLKF